MSLLPATIATHKTGRSARLVEFDPSHCGGIVQRFEQFTERARLAARGVSFEQVRGSRISIAPNASGAETGRHTAD
jgi:hypothetical protein